MSPAGHVPPPNCCGECVRALLTMCAAHEVGEFVRAVYCADRGEGTLVVVGVAAGQIRWWRLKGPISKADADLELAEYEANMRAAGICGDSRSN